MDGKATELRFQRSAVRTARGHVHDMFQHSPCPSVLRLFLPGGCFQKNTKKVTRAAFPAAARRELSFIMSLDVNFLMGYMWGPSKHITLDVCFAPVLRNRGLSVNNFKKLEVRILVSLDHNRSR